jgi:hypothetical protein
LKKKASRRRDKWAKKAFLVINTWCEKSFVLFLKNGLLTLFWKGAVSFTMHTKSNYGERAMKILFALRAKPAY